MGPASGAGLLYYSSGFAIIIPERVIFIKKFLFHIVFVLCFVTMLFSGYKLYTIYSDYSDADTAYEDVVDQFVTPVETLPPEDEDAPPEETAGAARPDQPGIPDRVGINAAPISVDFDALLAVNKFVVGWIYCPDTSINYPIVQTENNSDYLRRLLDGSYNRSGTLFLDYRNNGDFTSYNSIIYGHNMGNGKMFAPLMKYQKQDYYDAHPTMYLLTPQGNYRLDVMAGAVVDSGSSYYATTHTGESFRGFLDKICRNSTFVSDVDISTVERTVMLSTCTNWSEDSRYILVCALVKLEK